MRACGRVWLVGACLRAGGRVSANECVSACVRARVRACVCVCGVPTYETRKHDGKAQGFESPPSNENMDNSASAACQTIKPIAMQDSSGLDSQQRFHVLLEQEVGQGCSCV